MPLVSVFYFLILPIFWRGKNTYHFHVCLYLQNWNTRWWGRQKDRKKMSLSHMFKNLLKGDGRTRINIWWNLQMWLHTRSFPKSFIFLGVCFLHTVLKKLLFWLQNYLFGIDFRIGVYSGGLPNPNSELGMNSLEYRIWLSLQSWPRELILWGPWPEKPIGINWVETMPCILKCMFKTIDVRDTPCCQESDCTSQSFWEERGQTVRLNNTLDTELWYAA